MTNELDIRKCFEFVKELTLEAGKIFQRGFEDEKIVDTKTSISDLVTNYDRMIEELLVKGLKAEYPDHEIIAEECTGDTKELPQLTDKPTWLLDPIDGTINYVHSFSHSCISIGLAVCKDIVLGIIYDPIKSELYTAIKGEGAFLNGKPIHTSGVTEVKKALLELASFAIYISSKNRDINLGRFEALTKASQGIRTIGSAALAMAYVARGTLDGAHMEGLQPWDIAAGILIIREAGGTVIDTKGDALDIMKPKLIMAASNTLASEMKQLIVETDLRVLRKRLSRT